MWVAGAVRTLLMHFGDFPQDPRVAAELGAQWASDLEWFPRDVIESALTAWRRTETRRPTPAGIIRLCRDRMPRPAPVVTAIRAPREVVTDEAKERIRELTGNAFPELRRMPRGGE